MMKQKRSKGFTLVEMLACVVTLILLGLTGSVALNMATQSYWASVFESDSQLLESTIDLYIGDILRYSNEVKFNLTTIYLIGLIGKGKHFATPIGLNLVRIP